MASKDTHWAIINKQRKKMIQHTSESADKGKQKKLIILIVGIVVLALALSALGAFWYVKQSERTKAARKQCEVKVAQVMKAKNPVFN